MGRFRKKPVEIEAVRFVGVAHDMGAIAFDGFSGATPDWLDAALDKPESQPGAIFDHGDQLCVVTLEGPIMAQPGDWILQGVQGELYPCKPAIFAATYDEVAGA